VGVRSQAERAARNEALFRDINEQISEVSDSQQGRWFDALCECADAECVALIPITAEEYAHVRARSIRFALRAGHEAPEIERVVERHEHFLVVEKIGEGAEIAKELDPRSSD
jgi:hypothetical protein